MSYATEALEMAKQALNEAGAHELADGLHLTETPTGEDAVAMPAIESLDKEDRVLIHRAVCLIRQRWGWGPWCYDCWNERAENWRRFHETRGACPHG